MMTPKKFRALVFVLSLNFSNHCCADEELSPSGSVFFYASCVKIEKLIQGGRDHEVSDKVSDMLTAKPREIGFIASLWNTKAAAEYGPAFDRIVRDETDIYKVQKNEAQMMANIRQKSEMLRIAYLFDHWGKVKQMVNAASLSDNKLSPVPRSYFDELEYIFGKSDKAPKQGMDSEPSKVGAEMEKLRKQRDNYFKSGTK